MRLDTKLRQFGKADGLTNLANKLSNFRGVNPAAIKSFSDLNTAIAGLAKSSGAFTKLVNDARALNTALAGIKAPGLAAIGSQIAGLDAKMNKLSASSARTSKAIKSINGASLKSVAASLNSIAASSGKAASGSGEPAPRHNAVFFRQDRPRLDLVMKGLVKSAVERRNIGGWQRD